PPGEAEPLPRPRLVGGVPEQDDDRRLPPPAPRAALRAGRLPALRLRRPHLQGRPPARLGRPGPPPRRGLQPRRLLGPAEAYGSVTPARPRTFSIMRETSGRSRWRSK